MAAGRAIVRNCLLFLRHGRQWWYWTPAWQEGEREAEADIAAGRYTTYTSYEAFRAAMDEDSE